MLLRENNERLADEMSIIITGKNHQKILKRSSRVSEINIEKVESCRIQIEQNNFPVGFFFGIQNFTINEIVKR